MNFGYPPPLLFSAREGKFLEIDSGRMVQFLPLGLEVPEDHPDRKRYTSMQMQANCLDVSEITCIEPGDILFRLL